MKYTSILLALAVSVSACAGDPTGPILPSASRAPATSTILESPVTWYSSCTGLIYDGVVKYHFVDRTAQQKDGSADYKGHLNLQGAKLTDNLGRSYVFQEIVSGRQYNAPSGVDGNAYYLYTFRLTPMGNWVGQEVFTLILQIEWTNNNFTVTTSVNTVCR